MSVVSEKGAGGRETTGFHGKRRETKSDGGCAENPVFIGETPLLQGVSMVGVDGFEPPTSSL